MTRYEDYLREYRTPQPILRGLRNPGVVIEKIHARVVLRSFSGDRGGTWKYQDGGPYEYHVRVLKRFGAIECDQSGCPHTLTEKGSELLKKVEESIRLDQVEEVASLWRLIMLLDIDTGCVLG